LLGEAASPGPTHHVLDWFHLAMRVQHVAQAATSWPDTTETDRQAGARPTETIERIRWRLWRRPSLRARWRERRFNCTHAVATRHHRSETEFRRALAIARLPLPLRLLLLWLSLNIGRQVPNFIGNFAISALGSHGAAIVDTIPMWSNFLNYGPIAPDGGVDIYLSVDHRVMDGGPAARAIRALEAVLNGPVLEELRVLAGAS
jgi:hypothetical protein